MTTDTQEDQDTLDRRETIAAAFDAVETADNPGASDIVKTTPEDVKGGHVASKERGPDVTTTSKTDAPNDAPGSKSSQSSEFEDKKFDTEKAPQSWRAASKAKWSIVDPEVRQEVLRRERETTQVLNETANARQLATQLQHAVQPYMARLQSLNAHPIVAVQELLKADHVLFTAPKQQRAELLAKLISDYDIDIPTLDAVLAGKAPADPVESRVEQMLSQRLAPITQLLTQQQQYEQERHFHQQQELAQVVENLASDPKYPYFEQVRDAMADLIELSARRKQPLSIEAAYNKIGRAHV